MDRHIKDAVARRSDLNAGQKASLASILSHKCRTFGLPGTEAIMDPRPAHRK
jgi:hypothetical protein